MEQLPQVNKGNIVFTGFITTIIGIVLLFGGRFYLSGYFEYISSLLGLSIIVLGITFQMLIYLRSNRPKEYSFDFKNELQKIQNENLNFPIKGIIEDNFNQMKNLLNESNTQKIVFNDKERNEIIESIKQSISTSMTDETLKSVGLNYSEELKLENKLIILREMYHNSRSRLLNEIYSLSNRGNLNLIIGILTTSAAAGLLAYIIITNDAKPGDLNSFLWHYAPKFFTVIFIEVFSFFFLKLYKSSLNEIKFFQNELTTIEMKIIGLETALYSNDISKLDQAITLFVNCERNFILDKDKTTVELEKYKNDNNSIKEYASLLKDVFKSKISV